MNILLTKILPPSNLDLIKSFGWDYDIVETLNISPVDVKELPAETFDAWIISSRNSFSTVQRFIHQAPAFLYCVGSWMENELKKITSSQIKNFENMKALATTLQNQNNQRLLYFCADNHREELEQGMKGSGSVIAKVITHKSKLAYPTVKKNYDVVFVFSPRSAESLLKNNSFTDKTTFACIGPTTAEYLSKHGITKTFVASYPDSTLLLKEFNISTSAH